MTSMERTTEKRKEIKIVGLKVRTNNAEEIEHLTGKIFPCVRTYFHGGIIEQIPNRVHPGTTYCAYTDYVSDENGDYTYFIGEEVSSTEDVPDTLEILVIPAQTYAKFTNGPGAMPDVVRKPWRQIWQMSSQQLGGERNYSTDFEVYDERARDHQNIILDIYVGIQQD